MLWKDASYQRQHCMVSVCIYTYLFREIKSKKQIIFIVGRKSGDVHKKNLYLSTYNKHIQYAQPDYYST